MQEAEILRREPIEADEQASLAIEPREGPLDHPAVTSQAILRSRGARCAAGCRAPSTPRDTSGSRSPCRRAPLSGAAGAGHRRAGAARGRVEQFRERLAVVNVRLRQPDRQGDALGLDHKMASAARMALVRWIRAGDSALLFAATVELSIAARLQSISSAQANSCSSTACKCFHRPWRVH